MAGVTDWEALQAEVWWLDLVGIVAVHHVFICIPIDGRRGSPGRLFSWGQQKHGRTTLEAF